MQPNNNNKKIILLIIGIIIISLSLGFYFFKNRDNKNNTGEESTTTGGEFNPFGGGDILGGGDEPENPDEDGGILEENSKFTKITDFAVAGATFFEYDRPIEGGVVVEPTKIMLDAKTLSGRKEIQSFLNKELGLEPALKIDGNFGKATTAAIKKFESLKGLKETGVVSGETATYFYKLDTSNMPETERVGAIRYVEKATGHMYQMDLDKQTQNKISNSTIPQIHETIFNNNANTVIYRYLSEDKAISSYIATLGSEKGSFLPSNIVELATSPNKDKYFYLVKNDNGIYGTIKGFADGKTNSIFNSSFTEWLIDWGREDQILLTTKPSWSVSGAVFALNTSSGTLTKILGGIKGLTTLVNKNNNLLLYSESKNGPKLNIFNIQKHSSLDLDTYGLADKCVWSKDNINIYCAIPSKITGAEYPDVWYQGLVSFDDFFVKINTETGDKYTVANSTLEVPVDGIKLFLDNSENKLFFINKKDYTLWSLDLN